MALKFDVYAHVTETIIAEIETGTPPWRKPWTGSASGIAFPTRHNGEEYRGINVLMLWIMAAKQGHVSSRWMTYKQAKDLGGHADQRPAAQPSQASTARGQSRLRSCAHSAGRRFRSRYWLGRAPAIRTQKGQRGAMRGALHSDARCFQGLRGFRDGGSRGRMHEAELRAQELKTQSVLVGSRQSRRYSFARNRIAVLLSPTGHRCAWRARSLQSKLAQREAKYQMQVA